MTKVKMQREKVFTRVGRDAEIIDIIGRDGNSSWSFETRKDVDGTTMVDLAAQTI